MSSIRTRLAAQDRILNAIVSEASLVQSQGNTELAAAIRTEGARIAKRYGVTDVPGLPATKVGG